MRVPLLLAFGLTASSLLACGAPVEQGPEATSTTATAVIVVERSTGPGDAFRGDAVTARFVRTSQGAVDDPALRMAGVAEDITLTLAGTCTVPVDQSPIFQGRAVELLDVGQVVVESQSGKNTLLMPRSMPDPAGFVSGTFYVSPRSADVFTPSSRVSLRSSGAAGFDGFNITVTAPRDVTDVRIGTIPGGLDVAWDASESDPRDLVYIDVLSPAPRVVSRCTGADNGHLVVSTNVEEGQLAVHRLHKEAFKAKGIEPGEVRFDVAKIIAFRK